MNALVHATPRICLALFVFAWSLSGCTVSPEPIGLDEHIQRAQDDLTKIQSLQFTPAKPITLHEAIARAVAFNLKRRVKEIESEIAEAELQRSSDQMLPKLDLKSEKRGSNVQISGSDDRIAQSASATLAWNMLDLGVSYARAKQSADQLLIARENERKALQDIVREVRTSYFRAAGAQRLMSKLQTLGKDIKVAMRESHRAERLKFQDALTSAAYRRELVETVSDALTVQSELREAKAELASLLNIHPGTEFVLAQPVHRAALPGIPMSLPDMEEYALTMRPELRIEDYNERISEWQSREALYGMLPGLNLNASANFSSETTNLAQHWLGAGVQIGNNLLGLFSGVSGMAAAEKRGELARQQRVALSLAVLTQVNVGYIRYHGAMKKLELAKEVADADRRLVRLVSKDVTYLHTNFLEAVKLTANQLQSEVKEHLAYAELISAHGDLMHAVGLDIFPEEIDVGNIEQLSMTACRIMARWNRPGRVDRQATDAPFETFVNGMISGLETPRESPGNDLNRLLGAVKPMLSPRDSWRLDDLALMLVKVSPASDGNPVINRKRHPPDRRRGGGDQCGPEGTRSGYIW